jgi:formate dehydrogenase iron-sulfur subunit
MAEMAILYDTTKCSACRACQVACKQWNELPAVKTSKYGQHGYQNPPDLSVNTFVVIDFKALGGNDRDAEGNWNFFRHSCMHCQNAACKEMCDSLYDKAHPKKFKAIQRSPQGFIWVDMSRCFGQAEKAGGCGGACAKACPFAVPRVGKADISGGGTSSKTVMRKCRACIDRVEKGLVPSCVKTCGPEALSFGERGAMVAAAKARAADPAVKVKYRAANVYGAEAPEGGLHVIYVLSQPPQFYGLP